MCESLEQGSHLQPLDTSQCLECGAHAHHAPRLDALEEEPASQLRGGAANLPGRAGSVSMQGICLSGAQFVQSLVRGLPVDLT